MKDLPLQQRFADAMGQLLGPDFPSDIGLAVSGGGDSMAMLYLAHNWTRIYGVRLWVVTIDHGLRAESADEAAMVAEECAALGWSHATVRWHRTGEGNLQNAARRGRLDLIDRWRGAIRHVLMAHTLDDQAETVFMRLARGSGVDGLAGMRPSREVVLHPLGPPNLCANDWEGTLPSAASRQTGLTILRPCLEFSRDELRHYLKVLHGRWVDDPSNEDRRYERVRVRHLLNLLSEKGISATDLSGTANRMARARVALNARLTEVAHQICAQAPLGQVRIERDGFATLDVETQLRMLSAALRYVTSADYRPRAKATEDLLERILSGGGGTLHGAEVLIEKAHIRVLREASAVKDEIVEPGALWDGQWCLSGGDTDAWQVRRLGDEGWQQIVDRTTLSVPYRAALSLPALWAETRLIACPMLAFGAEVAVQRFVMGRPDRGFPAFCESH